MTEELQSTLALIVTDLGVDLNSVCRLPLPEADPQAVPRSPKCLIVDATHMPEGQENLVLIATLRPLMEGLLAEGVFFLFHRTGKPDTASLARFRNALWPAFHVPAVYLLEQGEFPLRISLGGACRLKGEVRSPDDSYVVVAIQRKDTMRPAAIKEKFDTNATGWNGIPGAPSYGHFRWMRRIITDCALSLPGQRVLDAGCGAGWVGIEAALKGASVYSFDPSPEMARIAAENARSMGVDIDVKVGFSEAPPFDEPFDTVFSAGVISFSPDHDLFIEGLDSQLVHHGILVIADVNPLSLGMRYRRSRHPVLPFRELNALSRLRVIEKLTHRGYTIEDKWHYQLTLPVPLLMHLSETRFGGMGSSLLLALNKAAFTLSPLMGFRTGLLFDSYIIRARKG